MAAVVARTLLSKVR